MENKKDNISPPFENIPQTYAAALEEIILLRKVAYQAYQICGAFGGTEEMLDNFLAAAEGLPLPHETFGDNYNWNWECGHSASAGCSQCLEDAQKILAANVDELL